MSAVDQQPQTCLCSGHSSEASLSGWGPNSACPIHGSPSSNEQGKPLWVPTPTLERLMRQTRGAVSPATVDANALHGIFVELLEYRQAAVSAQVKALSCSSPPPELQPAVSKTVTSLIPEYLGQRSWGLSDHARYSIEQFAQWIDSRAASKLQPAASIDREFHNIDDVVEIRRLRAALTKIANENIWRRTPPYGEPWQASVARAALSGDPSSTVETGAGCPHCAEVYRIWEANMGIAEGYRLAIQMRDAAAVGMFRRSIQETTHNLFDQAAVFADPNTLRIDMRFQSRKDYGAAVTFLGMDDSVEDNRPSFRSQR